jgi:hypothetical protein
MAVSAVPMRTRRPETTDDVSRPFDLHPRVAAIDAGAAVAAVPVVPTIGGSLALRRRLPLAHFGEPPRAYRSTVTHHQTGHRIVQGSLGL